MPTNEVLREVAGLVRIAVNTSLTTTQWLVNTTLQTGARVAKGLAEGESPTRIVTEIGAELRSTARETLGMPDEPPPPAHSSTEDLRARGAELLRQSADVHFVDGTHPAYERILSELTPDEARILRLLATEGPQPVVDVRTNRPLGIGSELIESSLSMIGRQAGVRRLTSTNAYLNNLFRLGLVWFSAEEVEPERYQVVEVQPEVQAAMAKAGRAPKTVRRSVHLTPFGDDFCEACLPMDS
ncbi:Abi-alpha family protein [Actinophytocola sediminis]